MSLIDMPNEDPKNNANLIWLVGAMLMVVLIYILSK